MARTHNPFAPKERSKLQTPWGEFECASPNKTRLAQIAAMQDQAKQLQGAADSPDTLGKLAKLAIDATSACLADGEQFAAAATAAWDADEVELAALQGAAEFVQGELVGGAAEGND